MRVSFHSTKVHLRNILCLLVLTCSVSMVAQEPSNGTGKSPFSKSKHRSQLKSIRQEAEDFAGTNKNKSALLRLMRYDRVSDSLFAIECSDTISDIEKAFKAGSSEKISAIDKNRKAMEENDKKLGKNRSTFLGLFRRSLMALGVWLIIIIVIMKIRNRKVKRVESQLVAARIQADTSENAAGKSHLAVNEAIEVSSDILSAAEQSRNAEQELKSLIESMPAGEEATVAATKKIQKFSATSRLLVREANITEQIARQEAPAAEEKTKVSINDLSDQALEICHRGHCMDPSSPFECQLSRDLEKNLPTLAVFPDEISAILVSIIDNAFLAVKERASKEEKGYVPKVGISTRILPSFIQVRIKDNGGGISPDEIERVQEEYYSKRPKGDGAGMGLSFAKKLLTERHKGELRIESEYGNSTDVYLKFYLR